MYCSKHRYWTTNLAKESTDQSKDLILAQQRVKALETQLATKHSKKESIDAPLVKSLQEKLLISDEAIKAEKARADYYEQHAITIKNQHDQLVDKLNSIPKSSEVSTTDSATILNLRNQIKKLEKSTAKPDFELDPAHVTALTIVFFHLYKIRKEKDNWSNRKTNKVFEFWWSEVKNLHPADYNHSKAWKICREEGDKLKTGLLKALLMCHDPNEQDDIIKQKEHNCTLFVNCPLSHIRSEDVLSIGFPPNFDDYLLRLLSTEFVDSYFDTDSSKYGISILRILYPACDNPEYEMIMKAITCSSTDFQSLEHLSRVEPSPRSSRSYSTSKSK